MKRNGSALLIVIGVLAFLLISAVAFSAFMRRARLPSTYLRRNAAARQLAKAALAEAIDDLDRAIANDVHPGLGSHEGNVWRQRVFFRDPNPVDLALTAPILTLEGLAYIPPPLVNEARYLQRNTPTAQWKPFHFDVGRYAYIALDVSDYFDVNRMVADVPRSSSPNGRVRIAHLFESANHRSAPSNAPEWDQWMENYRTFDEDTQEVTFDQGGKLPLVSVADFNLALGRKGGIGRLRSPFYDYLTGSGSGSFYSKAGTPSQSENEMLQSMTLVTDGWYPREGRRSTTTAGGTRTTQTVYDLNDPKNQPYKVADLEADRMTVDGAFASKIQSTTKAEWLNRLSGLGCALLADYLDADRTPLSLAFPSVERVPMICGIAPNFGRGTSKFSLTRDPTQPEVVSSGSGGSQNTSREVRQWANWRISSGVDGLGTALRGGSVDALVTFPFLHHDESDDNYDFKVDGRLALFFSAAANGVGTRTDPADDTLHMAGREVRDLDLQAGTGVIALGLKFGAGDLPIKSLKKGTVDRQEDAVARVTSALPGNLGSVFAQTGNEFLRAQLKWTQTRTQKADGSYTDWAPTLDDLLRNPAGHNLEVLDAACAFPPLTAGGKPSEDFTTNLKDKLLTLNQRLRLNAAVWLRIKDDKSHKVVDMVPACTDDDRIQNGKAQPRTLREFQVIAGESYPVMRFNTGVEFDFSLAGLRALERENEPNLPIEVSPRAVLVADPRYNYAPEHWYVHPDAQNFTRLEVEDWTQHNCFGQGGCEDDIFMASSDAGYLQSPSELAFLPRVTDLRTYGQSDFCGNFGSLKGIRMMDFPTLGQERNHNLMWRNYDPIDLDADAFDQLPFTSEGTGVKVNPYSDSTNVLMMAFVNTPIDWRRATTNVMDGATDYASMHAAEYNKEYAWNEYSSGGRFGWLDLEQIAGRFMQLVRANPTDWLSSWRDLGWFASGREDEFLTLKMSPETDRLWSCDRRFFYGYWRDCFEARQQLFLIFVRAEQLMLAGGEADQLPPQKGGRAVALVWRDPRKMTASGGGGAAARSNADGYPHRTRILFFHQLD